MEEYKEQALATVLEPPLKRKRHIYHHEEEQRGYFLELPQSATPVYRFTMETENNNRIFFLDSLVTREPQGELHTSVYRKPTHTDQYLAYDSHHPQSIKRGIVKCSHDRAKRIITKPSGIAQEKKHLFPVHAANGYPSSFLQKVTKTRNPAPERETVEFKSTAVLPYIRDVSETLRRNLQQQGIHTRLQVRHHASRLLAVPF